ncbi:MAG: hypothetical protein HY078_15030 [Elusimicrobia bacterium]|nr:hypothetical protein [Elusimicrobiota bacterium]
MTGIRIAAAVTAAAFCAGVSQAQVVSSPRAELELITQSRPAPIVPQVSAAPAPESKPTLIGRITPYQKWPAFGAKTKGLLVQKEIAGVCRIDHMHTVRQVQPVDTWKCVQGDDNTYAFSEGDSSPFAVYFKSSGEGYNFLRNWRMRNGFQADAAQFARTTPNAWGLNDEAHIAEVTVNGGQGTPANEIHFIITDATVQSTPAQAVRSFLGRFSTGSREVAAADKQLKDAIAKLPSRGPSEAKIYAGFTATWFESRGILRVTYYRKATDVHQKDLGTVSSCAPCRGQRCPPCPPPQHRVYTYTRGAEWAIQEDFNKAGTLLKRRRFPVSTFANEHTSNLPH